MTHTIKLDLALTFDDVLLVPSYSDVLPSQVDVSTWLTRGIKLNIPILSAAMDTVTEAKMAIAMAQSGGIGFVHKNNTMQEQGHMVQLVKETKPFGPNSTLDERRRLLCGAAIGVGDDSFERARYLITWGVDVLVVDTAHGHSKGVGDMVAKLKDAYSNVQIIAGNVTTAEAVEFLAKAGADAIKVGQGSGTICVTRTVAGIGVPQLSAIRECAAAADEYDIPIIADGGIQTSGDMMKALAAGASTVMVGSLLAGSDESPGDIVYEGRNNSWSDWFMGTCSEGTKYKKYRGMGSIDAMQMGSKDRYLQSGVTDSKKLVAEGVSGLRQYTGPVADTLYQLVGGIRSGMGYTGSHVVPDLWHAKFIRITPAGVVESRVHDMHGVAK